MYRGGGIKGTAEAASVTLPTPVLSLDFDSGTLTGNNYTENNFQFDVVGAQTVADPDNGSNKVMSFSTSTDGSVKGSQYLKSKVNALKDTSFANGFTISMKVRPKKLTVGGADWTYLFGLGHNNDDGDDSYAGWNYVDGTMGLITRYGDAYTAHFPGDGWVTGNPVNSAFDYFVSGSGADKWSTVTYVFAKDNVSIYMNENCICQWSSSSALADILKTVNTGRLNLGTGISAFAESYVGYMDDVKVFNEGLSAEQIYKFITGKEPASVDKSELNKVIESAEKAKREELYADATVFAAFVAKLSDAKSVSSNASTTQVEVDAAKEALIAAQKALVLKSIELTKDLVLDSDIGQTTSVVNKTKKEITAGGYLVKPEGSSSIGEGYIQSSVNGKAQEAGISLDKALLDGVTLNKGITFNIKWKFSSAPASDWWDLISFVDANNAYLMRSTVGFVNVVGSTQLFPGTDCKNGYAWDSCKTYETNVVKNLTVTIDNSGIRMYVDGTLACEKTDLSQCDFSTVFSGTKNIYIGRALIAADGDLQGQLTGVQVYHRALNAAEVDKLAADGTGAGFGISSTEVSVEKGSTQTVEVADTVKPADTSIKSAVCEDSKIATAEVKNGKLEITGVAVGKTTVIVNSSYGRSIACAVNVVGKVVAVTGIKLDKQSASVEEGGTLKLTASVLPEDATSKSVTWQSDDPSVATVDENGKVTGVKAGTATITVASKEDSTKSASCKVTVTEKGSADDTPGGGVVNDESKLGTYRSDLAYKRVSVHDPSVVQDPKTKRYYIFGSHCAWAWSDDLQNWTAFTNNITEGDGGSAHTIFKDEIDWCKKANANYTVTGNLWAPDVIWDENYKNADGTTGAWLMYMSINGPKWNSTISLLTSDRLDGNWTYVGPVIRSGMSNGFGPTFDYQKVTGGTDVSRYTSSLSNGGNPTREAHAIDPCVLYDDKGDLWMAYGSWSGGISMIKLDKETGLRDYSTTYADTNNAAGADGLITDPYTGYKLAGGNAVSGEGTYIKKIGEFYYMFLSYGAYAPDGGYNMRVFRASDIKGPYKDVANKDARTVLNSDAGDYTKRGTTGMRIMSYYKWNFADYGYTAQGHNSATVDPESGKAFVIYHNKYNDGTAAHDVRVHQLLTNEDGWILAAPFEYAGESVKESGYTQNAIVGDYGIMLQKQNIDHKTLQCEVEQKITLEAGTGDVSTGYSGNITGDLTGTWISKANSPYITLTIGGTEYKGILCEGTFDETDVKTMTFTAVGSNQECLWGYKAKDPTVAIRMTIDKAIKLPDNVVTDIPLPSTGVGGSKITWKSNSIAIGDDGTVPHLFDEDTKASMTATITNNGYEYSKVYEFTVVGNTKLSAESDVAIKSFYTGTELDMSKLQMGSCPKVDNPFHYTHEDLSNGVSISFDVTRTAVSDRLSNIISFNNKLGKMYFTGGSYFGFNDFNGRFMDANLNSGFAPGTDYLKDNTKVTIKIEITSEGAVVYQDGTKVYTSAEVKAGTVPGGFSANNPEATMLAWIQSAPELNFGSGNFWNDLIFKGKISNVVCAYRQPEMDINSAGDSSLVGIYTQDFEKVKDISTEWQATAAEFLSLGKSDDGHGKYMEYTVSASGNRGAHSYFGTDITWPDNYILEYDMVLNSGTDATRESQIAVLTKNAAYNNNAENDGIATGYVFKMTAANSTTWTINDDTSKTVTIPKTTWVHIQLTGAKNSTAAHLKITDGETVLFDDDVTATDSETIKGLYIRASRASSSFKLDNIVVTDKDNPVNRTAYDKMLARAEQYAAAQEKASVYSAESFQILADAIDTAKNTVTNSSAQDVFDAQAAALEAAIKGLVRAFFTVTVAEPENGTVTGLAADGKYFAGDSMSLKAVPNDGFAFGGWKIGDNVVSENTSYSAMVTANITITAVFKKSEDVSPSESPDASSSPSSSPSPSASASAAPTPRPTSSNPGGGSSGGNSPWWAPSASPSTSPSTEPDATGKPETSATPSTPTIAPTVSPAPTATAKPQPTKAPVKKDKVYTVGSSKYKVTSITSKKKTVTLLRVPKNKTVKNLKVGATVKIKGQTFKITKIDTKAFANCKKLESVVIGKNVTTLGAKCFAGCTNLKKVTFKTKVLKKVGKDAFKKINKKAVLKVPKAKLKKYKNLLKKKVQPSTVKVTK
ncbi:MAG: family 43 glycosylhydrolase [Lachnospiraceae bacterium]|nr:family 43 glycosylhydrolase [Lachnospiraceae bacterium]